MARIKEKLPSGFEYATGQSKERFLVEAIQEALLGFAGLPQQMIKGLSPKAAKALRKLMQVEMVKRGKPPLRLDIPVTGFNTAPKAVDPVDKALRGTWFRGQKTIPEAAVEGGKLRSNLRKAGSMLTESGLAEVEEIVPRPARPDFRYAKIKSGNLGEPTGISMSLDPEVASKFSKLKEEEIARVMPLYGGPPEDVILHAWTKRGGETLKDVYKEAVKEIFPEPPVLLRAKHSTTGKDIPASSMSQLKMELKDYETKKKFNQLITEKLQQRGYKGILYSPHRFDEFELKMFNPEDVVAIDRRKVYHDPTFERMHRPLTARLGEFARVPGTAEKQSLRDWYREITFKELYPKTLLEDSRSIYNKTLKKIQNEKAKAK